MDIMLPILYCLFACHAVAALHARQTAASPHAHCRFAPLFSQDEIMHDSSNFEANIFYWDGQFHKDGIGYRASNGMTIGHTTLGFQTGLPPSRVPDFTESTPRNEAYHIMLLTLAISGNSQAQTFVYSANPADAAEMAASILALKLDAYLEFNQTYPGFGGFLPQFESNVTTIRASQEWQNKISAADNGQLLWAVYGMVNILMEHERPEFQHLGDLWSEWFLYARAHARGVFMQGPSAGDVCAVVTLEPGLLPYMNGQKYACEDYRCLNNDPYQGELMSWFIYFSAMLDKTEGDLIWEMKRPQLLAANYTGTTVDTSDSQVGAFDYHGHAIVGRHITPITTQKGLYFSSDEQIKLLFMPYLDSSIVGRVFKNAERIRTCNSMLMAKTPGMFAAAPNATSANGSVEYVFVHNSGIPAVAVSGLQELEMITPYAVFPTILFDRPAGLVWYRNMIDGRQMQTIYGSTAAARRDGSLVARFVSWESKGPTLLALTGSFVDIVRDGMKKDKIYDEFTRILEREYGAVFDPAQGAPPLKGEIVPICLPNAPMPTSSLIDFSTCNQSS